MSDYSDSAGADSAHDPARGPGLVSSASAPAPSQVSSAWAQSVDRDETTETNSPASNESAPTPTIELTDVEARVLGSLIEKSFLTPDVYPMTTNGLVTACNQKTNRDPVVDFSAVQIDSTLLELRQRNVVRRVHAQGARSTKHRQTLDEVLALNEQELALMSVLLLRGPQTMGELRVRTERHNVGFDDLGAVDDCLERLASRTNPLVRELPRQPGHKENRWSHLIGDSSAPDIPMPHADLSAPAATKSVVSAPAVAAPEDAALVARVVELETQVAQLQRQLASLAESLGESLG